MSVKVNVKMTEKHMHNFMVHHNYTHASGILGVAVGLVSLFIATNNLSKGDLASSALWIFFALFFLIITPFSMKKKARMQVQNNPMFQKPLECEFTKDGVIIRQDDKEELNYWDGFTKAISTKYSIILYFGKVRAFIFPKDSIGDKYGEVLQMIQANMPPNKVKIRP